MTDETDAGESAAGAARPETVALVKAKGYRYSAEPFTLASGQKSHDFIDAKLAVADGRDLRAVAREIIDRVGGGFDVVGGLTMGADALTHAVALEAPCSWFSVRKQPKGRGTNQWIEGASLSADSRVLLVDDVVTTGGSIVQAYDQVVATGARVVAVATLVDRGDIASATFADLLIPYHALVSYTDLGIVAVEAPAAR